MAEQYLLNLPCRGNFTDPDIEPASMDALRVYVCDHDTDPALDQIIGTDQTNILIRALTMKKLNKAESKLKEAKKKSSDTIKGKRPADGQLDDRSTKKANISSSSMSSETDASSSPYMLERDLQSCTVEKLRALLKERGLPVKGKKDELITRLRKS